MLAVSHIAIAQTATVEVQEDVYTYLSANNGSGPLWSFGCTSIARVGGDVYINEMDTGEQVEPLCNTRWRLLRREDGAWTPVAEAHEYRQREPCSLAVTGDAINIYVNDSRTEPGTRYQDCFPHILRLTLSESVTQISTLIPRWNEPTTFTDHSYRGFAADSRNEMLLMLNIDAKTSKQHYALIDRHGVTRANGAIVFPIRACYPQVALAGNGAHVMAIGDIVEPNETWRAYKAEQTGRSWDYVFRRLFYVHAADLKGAGFGEPIEIANLDATAGHIRNQDLAIGPDGEAYVLYTARETQNELMRDRFFPDASLSDSLHLAVIRDGEVVERRVLIGGAESSDPGCAKFHVGADGALYILLYVGGDDGGNKLLRLDGVDVGDAVDVNFDPPFTSFSLADVRAGNAPSNTIDVFGNRKGRGAMAYGRVRVAP